MEIVKKNLVSIICGAVVLIAIGATFWPIAGWFEDLRTKASARGSVYNQLRELLNKERHLPIISLQEGAVAEKLEQFPTEKVIAMGNKVKEDMAAEAKAMYQEAVALNRQGKDDKLVKGVLPQPERRQNATALQTKFVKDYRSHMDYSNPAARATSMPVQIMSSGMKPTEEEITRKRKDIERYYMSTELARDPKTNKPLNEPEVRAKIRAAQDTAPNQMRVEAARACAVYVDPESFDTPSWMTSTGGNPSFPQIFWAQICLWLQEDICRAIKDANGNATTVTDATVKRLIKMDLPDDFTKQGTTTGADQSDPAYSAPSGTADLSQPLQKDFGVSPTGRYSNPLYDVMTFKLSLHVDADRVPAVLQALSKNRFITVHDVNISAVDSGKAQADGYDYGTRPVVQLDMQCEALFMRDWTTKYMPPVVKTRLGIPPEEPAPQG